ncbi:hypothetical protein AD948_04325 [Acetobacter senegalensis]|uniref:Uncharacterized protein n=1 Tax=Acetobacter senegalensis TaxID=446692 RepID=A0A149U5K2_9PROT|nr:hypothetical protein AD948_04325 [Acetobacter senegalensis]
MLAGIIAIAMHPTASFADQRFIDGTCGEGSHIAEGAFGDDLTKRQSRFFCDAAAIISNNGDILVQFSQKEAHHNPSLAYAGRMSGDKDVMNVERVYFSPQNSATVSDGVCKFFYKDTMLTGIMCGVKIDETGRRTTAIVVFNSRH